MNLKQALLIGLFLLTTSKELLGNTLETHSVVPCKSYTSEIECKKAAQNDALSSLSMELLTEVNATSLLQQSKDGTEIFQWQSQTSSQLPILGATLSCKTQMKGQSLWFACEARMQAEASAIKYQTQLHALKEKIDENAKALFAKVKGQQGQQGQQVQQYYKLLSDIQQFDKLRMVYMLLAPQGEKITLGVSTAKLTEKLYELESLPANFTQLAKILANQVDRHNILIKPVLLSGSQEVTPFASMLYQELVASFSGRTSSQIKEASFVLSGSYQIQNQQMVLALSLSDKSGVTLISRVWQLPESLYASYNTKPTLLNFDQLLLQGVVQDDKFKVEIQTNKGSNGVVFVEGEVAQLLVKVNRSGFFYIVGHTQNDKGKTSYLMEVTNEIAPYSFERYVGPDEINQWLKLGEFEIQPDFGNESLQVFASDQSFKGTGRLPQTGFDGTYHAISGPINAIVIKTRGLVRKKTVSGEAFISAEANIMFQTVAKY